MLKGLHAVAARGRARGRDEPFSSAVRSDLAPEDFAALEAFVAELEDREALVSDARLVEVAPLFRRCFPLEALPPELLLRLSDFVWEADEGAAGDEGAAVDASPLARLTARARAALRRVAPRWLLVRQLRSYVNRIRHDDQARETARERERCVPAAISPLRRTRAAAALSLFLSDRDTSANPRRRSSSRAACSA